MKRLLIYMFAMLMAFAACVKEEPVSVSFTSDTYQMTVGDTLNLGGELVVVNYDKRPLLSVDVDSIVDVKADGRVVALAEGEAVITATADGVSASCTVVVSDISLEKITLTAPGSVLAGDMGAVVKAVVEPKGYSLHNLDWRFSSVPENLQFEYSELRPGEYNVKVKEFVKDAKVTVIVAGKKETAVADTAVIAVVREVVQADRILLDMPARLTGGVDGVWAPVSVTVEPGEFDLANLVWNFTATDGLEFKTEEVTPGEYKVYFSNYVEGGKLAVEVRDANSETFNKGDITVQEKPVEGAATLVFKSEAMNLYLKDDPWTPELICEPDGYDPYLLVWSMSDESVVDLEDGKVTPLKEGKTELTVKDMVSGKEAKCEIEVIEAVETGEVVSIEMQRDLVLKMNEDVFQLTTICRDASGNIIKNYSGIEWVAATVEDSFGQQIPIVEVSDRGVVTPKYVGTTQVTARVKNRQHVYAMCHVTVVAAEIKVEKVNLSHTDMKLAKGYSIPLGVSVLPADADNKTVRFSSSNEAVASVSEDGLVTGNAIGEADVYAIAANGVMSKCHVKVVDKALYLDATEVVMAKGAVRELVLSRVPEDGFSGNVSWASSNTGVVTVSNGKVTAVGEGNAKVTASVDGFATECAVEVVGNGFLDGMSFGYSDPSVEFKGLQQDMTVRLIPMYEHNGSGTYVPAKVSWSSSKPDIATVDGEGNVTAVVEEIKESGMDKGQVVTITHDADGRKASVNITVVKAMPQEIVLLSVPEVDGEKYKMRHGESFVFEAKVIPEKASQVVNIQSSASGVGFLEGGRFYANSPGKVNFTAYAGDDTNVRYHFSVDVLPVPGTQVQLSNTGIEIMEGSEAALIAEVLPENASYKTITWKSSDESIATVDQDGIVRGISEGKAVITALQEENAISATCEVTVKAAEYQYSIGDYLYSSGKVSSKPDLDEATYGKVIGVIFSLNNPTLMGDTALAEDFPDCTHGFAVGINEVSASWSSMSNEKSWLQNNGHGAVMNENIPNGYYNTKALGELWGIRKNEDGFGENYMAMFDAETGVAARYNKEVAVPEKASTWYVASFMDMKLLYENRDVVNESLKGASGDDITDGRHWISTLFDGGSTTAYYAFDFKTGGRTQTQPTASESYPVRLILAF